ncbi:hypothetical protein QWY20_03655 [Alkalimonas sp. MEB108]|uniref:Adhesin domain-containing protein n=1 Tax=Alkalimonas cellulosilytica TaxID=3058395 RepID=A0ABU7J1Z4_9GAMM|nr:hypothetical protein [Alkalimonas sp. MEB108]MEE2000536.1 hypothetical protein [Alkalimonas sp. MEB108]
MKRLLFIAFLLFFTLPLSALADEKQLALELDASALNQLMVEVGVGQIQIETADTDRITLKVTVRGEKRWWFFSHKVGDVELKQQLANGQLQLSIPKDNTKQHWQLTVPASLAVKAELGVGQFYANHIRSSYEVDVGVGQISSSLNAEQFQRIELSAGVGNVNLHNAPSSFKTDRHLVGGSLEWSGPGSTTFKANVGVGDISLTHQN